MCLVEALGGIKNAVRKEGLKDEPLIDRASEALPVVGLFCIVPAAIERDRSGASS